ncbi:MAG TPA: polyprenol monophosphomannose synthase [Candidatus Kapabacteria bacterium]|nr:polyprenol monophosphomannose synthase [Candidatus Kapabacteria bacterium]
MVEQFVPQRALVIIPTYNEIDNVPSLIGLVLDTDPRIDVLFVDDGSPDGTGDYIRTLMEREPRVHLLQRPRKMGLGTAYCRGFEYAIEQGYDVAMEMDADFSHDPKVLPRFLEEIESADLVIGSRYVKGVNVINWPMSRLLLSYFANMYSRFVTGMPLHDGTGGFKCFRTEVLKRIDLGRVKSNGYSFQIELNFLVWSMGKKIVEIPIVFEDRRSGVSKMSRNIIFEAAGMVWKLRFAKLFGTLKKRYLRP